MCDIRLSFPNNFCPDRFILYPSAQYRVIKYWQQQHLTLQLETIFPQKALQEVFRSLDQTAWKRPR